MEVFTVKQFSVRHPAFSEASLRWMIFRAEDRVDSRGKRLVANGFKSAFVRCGRKLMISEKEFFRCLLADGGNPQSE
jgi:hypothetical protein